MAAVADKDNWPRRRGHGQMLEFSTNASRHCPFLNRADPRCQQHFQIDDLEHAFEVCFGGYSACPVYLELLSRRRIRQANAGIADAADAPRDTDLARRDDQPRPTNRPLRVIRVAHPLPRSAASRAAALSRL